MQTIDLRNVRVGFPPPGDSASKWRHFTGFTTTLDHPSEQPFADIAAVLQANLAAVGIKASLLPATGKQLVTKMWARQHQLVLNQWFPDYFDPNSNAQAFNANADDSDQQPVEGHRLAQPLLRQGADE